jgi:hypothetical protein
MSFDLPETARFIEYYPTSNDTQPAVDYMPYGETRISNKDAFDLLFDATIEHDKDSLKAVKTPLEYCRSGHPAPCTQSFPLYPCGTSRQWRLPPDYHQQNM